MEKNHNLPDENSFKIITMDNGRTMDIKAGTSLFPHTQGLSNLVTEDNFDLDPKGFED